MINILDIVSIGFFDGLTWFPIVLTIGILYKYLKTIDVSIDGIVVVSSIAFTTIFNFSNSLFISLSATVLIAVVCYCLVSFLSTELKINSLLAGIIVSLILHSISVIWVGESVPLNYSNLTYLNSNTAVISITVIIAVSTELFFRTRFGTLLKVAGDNHNVNIKSNPRTLLLIIYMVSGLILSLGVVQYTCKIGLARSGGGFEFLVTALSSFLVSDRLIDFCVDRLDKKKQTYTFAKYYTYSIIQSPVSKALIGSIAFQIVVMLIIYYTNNPAYWRLIFGIVLLAMVAKPTFRRYKHAHELVHECHGLSFQKISFQFDLGYEKRQVFNEIDFTLEKGINIIWGNNGVGKTSLLKLISGELTPQKGSIIKDGKNITAMRKHERSIFFINQVPYDSLSPNLTVFENTISISNEFSTSNFDFIDKDKAQQDFSGLAIQFGRQNSYWTQRVGNLSGGQAQKLNLLLCGISDADIILADEPTSGIDAESLQVFKQFIDTVSKNGRTMIIVTHDERLKQISANHYKLENNSLTKMQQHES